MYCTSGTKEHRQVQALLGSLYLTSLPLGFNLNRQNIQSHEKLRWAGASPKLLQRQLVLALASLATDKSLIEVDEEAVLADDRQSFACFIQFHVTDPPRY